MTKRELPNKSTASNTVNTNRPKVVMMLVDALREDFVEWPDISDERARILAKQYLDPPPASATVTHSGSRRPPLTKASSSTASSADLFEDLLIDQPKNTVMLPLESVP